MTPERDSVAVGRWIMVPFAYALACLLGVWVWLSLGSLLQSACPSEKIWYGGSSGDAKCHFPLWVFFLKDMFGASLLAASLVLSCAWSAPAAKRTVAFTAAVLSGLVGCWYLWQGFNPWTHVLSHRLATGITFSLALVVVAVLVPRRRYRQAAAQACCARNTSGL